VDRKSAIHNLLAVAAYEVLEHIKAAESEYDERWVPAASIKQDLELNFLAVPKGNQQYGEKGWLFGILARMLEDSGDLEYRKDGNRAYYRSTSASCA
jgi:hypothetical protein